MKMVQLTEKRSLIASVLAAVGASVCCVLPLVLVMLGIGGSWVSTLTAMSPYRPLFIGLTVLFLGLAFYRLYLKPKACVVGEACANPSVLRRQRFVFWIVAGLVLGLLAVPWLVPWFY